jgi:hypothetical protein
MKVINSYVGVLAVILFMATGCSVFRQKNDGIATRGGLPDAKWQVGGGFAIDFTAPEDGMAYVVDLSAKRYLVTESLSNGENFSFWPDTEEDFKAAGIDPAKANIAFYFVPTAALYPPVQVEE